MEYWVQQILKTKHRSVFLLFFCAVPYAYFLKGGAKVPLDYQLSVRNDHLPPIFAEV